MRCGRLQLLAAGSLLLAINACAPNAAVNSIGKLSSPQSQVDVIESEDEQHISFTLPIPRSSDVADSSSWIVNGNFGVWFNEWSGVSLDGSILRASDNGFKESAASVTPLLVLRMRLLKSSHVPDGRMQPYIGVGPGIFFANQDRDFYQDTRGNYNTTHMSVGIDFRAGMRWQIYDKLGFFGEYRMTHYTGYRESHDRTALHSRENATATFTTNNFMSGLKIAF